MYWRTSTLDVENNTLLFGRKTIELYLTTDDYTHFIKFDEDERSYPWCIMRPFGTRYGSEIVDRYQTFTDAFDSLKTFIKRDCEGA